MGLFDILKGASLNMQDEDAPVDPIEGAHAKEAKAQADAEQRQAEAESQASLADTLKTAAAQPSQEEKTDTKDLTSSSKVQQQMALRDLVRSPAPIDYSGLDLSQKNLQDAISRKDVPKTAGEIQSLLNQTTADAIKSAQTSPEYQKYADTLKDVQQQLADSKNDALDRESKIGWLSAAESIGQALTQYAAARYGLQHGVNLAGLKMDKTDWMKLLDQSQAKLQHEVANLSDFRKEVSGQQAKLVEEAAGTAKEAVRGQLQGEKEARQADVEMAQAGVQGEEKKLQYKLAEEGLKQKGDYEEALANARMAASQGHGKIAPEFKKLQTVEIQAANQDQKAINQQEKALQTLQGLAGKYDLASKKKDKEKILAEVTTKLHEQGLDPSVIQKATGWFSSSMSLDSGALKQQLDQQQALLEDKRTKLHDYTAQVATADTPEEIQALRNSRNGRVSAPATQSTGQAAPSDGMIRVRQKATGNTGSIKAADFDPAKYDKI